MPKLSVLAIRLSLLYFATGTAVGSLLLAGKAVPIPGWMWLLRPAHVEAMLFGFMVQLVMGVAFWMLPRVPGYDGKRQIGMALTLLNAGVLLAAAAPLLPGFAVAGRVCEGAALVLFGTHIWPRVRPARRP